MASANIYGLYLPKEVNSMLERLVTKTGTNKSRLVQKLIIEKYQQQFEVIDHE